MTARLDKSHLSHQGVQFLQRVSIAVSAVLAIVNPSVRLSVRLSQSGIVSKRLKLGSWDLH